jgi:hypothetical protein
LGERPVCAADADLALAAPDRRLHQASLVQIVVNAAKTDHARVFNTLRWVEDPRFHGFSPQSYCSPGASASRCGHAARRLLIRLAAGAG